MEKGTYADHDWEVETKSPTCQAQGYDEKTCKLCGKEETDNYTAISDHTWEEEYRFDNSFHWIKCQHCDETKEKEEHDIDESGYCTVCDQPLAPTEGIVYDVSADGTYAEVIGYEGEATKIVIADEYNNLPVKNIYDESFYNKTIISVVIPDSVTTIGSVAFHSCDNLTSITLPDSVTTIGSGAFYNCDNLTSITLPDSVTTIGSTAFLGCARLTSITLPDSVTTIGRSAFNGCPDSLFTIYDNVKYLGSVENPYYALIETVSGAYSSYEIHSQTKVIADYAFASCSRLTSVTIPDSVTTIGSVAFYSCDNLTSITLPDSVISIGDSAFYGCDNLTSVYYRGTAEEWAAISIDEPNNKLTSATRYYYIENETELPTDGGNYWHYVDGVVTKW